MPGFHAPRMSLSLGDWGAGLTRPCFFGVIQSVRCNWWSGWSGNGQRYRRRFSVEGHQNLWGIQVVLGSAK